MTLNGRPRKLFSNFTVELQMQGRTCLGDSGSPLVRKSDGKLYVDGIYSLSTGMCGGEDEVSFYMDIKSYEEWIDSAIKNDRGELGVMKS